MQMKKMILAGLFVASALGCHATTSLGGADGGCNVTLPEAGFYGPNILYPGEVSFVSYGVTPESYYELVVGHDADAAVSVKMTLLSGSAWYIGGQSTDWRVTLYDGTTGTQTFGAPGVTGEFEESIFFAGTGQARVDVFECDASSPTLSKTISWGPATPVDAGLTADAASDARGSAPMGGSFYSTSDLWHQFVASCGGCHVEAALGGWQVTQNDFSSLVTEAVVQQSIKTDDPSLLMPPSGANGEPYSRRAPGDPLVQLAKLLELWISQGSPPVQFYVPTPDGGADAAASTDAHGPATISHAG
jgi:hypothetical protein